MMDDSDDEDALAKVEAYEAAEAGMEQEVVEPAPTKKKKKVVRKKKKG